MPLISIIIPVYNGERFLRETLESALAQAHSPLEVICIDDGSTDGSAGIIHSTNVASFHKENGGGPSGARNLGLQHAQGEYIAFLDQDDVLVPQKLSRQLTALEADQSAGFALCHMRYLLDEDEARPGWFRRGDQEKGEPGFVPSCWLVRREVMDLVGEFNPARRYAQDIDWLARAKDLRIKSHMVTETLVLKRVHGNNLVGNLEGAKADMIQSLRDSVARQRRLAGK